MNNGQKSLSINETFIVEGLEGDVLSACTGFYTNALISCTGNTQILLSNNIIKANSAFSATTFYGDGSNLTGISTQDTFVTGGTYSAGTAVFTNNTGGTFNVTGFYTGATDVFVTGGTYSDGNTIFTNNTGGTFNVSGFYTGATDVFVTGATKLNDVATFVNNTGGTFTLTGLTDTIFTGGTVSGATNFTGGLTANTISATTYQNLPISLV